jgi:hypothetical protein
VVLLEKGYGLEMADWEGHEIATSAALLDVITTATTGSARPSNADRILFTACEFWASARNRTLLEQLTEDPAPQMQAAEAAFTLIGLAGTAEIIANGRRILAEGSPASLQQVAQGIENSLAHIDEPVDQMIARYAKQQARARQN